MNDCLSMEAVLALAEGKLSEPEAAKARAHIAGCLDCTRRFALASGPVPPPRLSPTLNSPAAQHPVTRSTVPLSVGRYRIVRELGRGAMGVVMLAEDTLLARQVALKAVGPASADGELASHVSSEARAIARLQHPNVVGLFDVLQHAGQVYLAMEYVEGGDLQRWLRTPRTATEIVELFLQAAAGLEAAHDAGVVHRDFKPANVLVGLDGRARVSDFGLATMQGERDAVARGALVGTPAYMAPEQFAGKLAGAAADQFAFCAALFEALSGQRPFVGEDLGSLRDAVMKGPPAVPGNVSPALAAVLRRGLSTEPKDRFPSLRDVSRALREASGARRRRQQRVALAVATVLAVAGLGVLLKPRDPCALGATRLAKVWPPANVAAVPNEVRTWLERINQDWSEAWVGQCHAWQEQKVSDAEWQRTRGCLEAALDDVESVAAASVVLGESKPASMLLQYVAQPKACAATGNPARSGLPVETTARQRVVDTLVAIIETAVLDQEKDMAGALRRANEAVELAVASHHAPTHARALLVLSRLQYNSQLNAEAVRSNERAVSLAQSSGALHAVARAEQQAAFDVCLQGDPGVCLPRLERLRVMANTLEDPWLRTWVEELTLDSDWSHPATTEQLAALVAQWKKLPGARVDVARGQRRLARALTDARDYAGSLAVTLELIPEKAPLLDLGACEVSITRARAYAGLGRIDDALRLLSDVQVVSERKKFARMRTDALNEHAQTLLDNGRAPEVLTLIPADTEEPQLYEKRIFALLQVGEFDEAKRVLEALTFPSNFRLLDDYTKRQLRYHQSLLALERRDAATLTHATEWLGADSDPGLLAAALTTRGLESEARALLKAQPPELWMLHVELAQRERKWADALALLDLHVAEVNQFTRTEAALRRAYTEVMLGQHKPEACLALEAAREQRKHEWFALFPNEFARLEADVKGKCR